MTGALRYHPRIQENYYTGWLHRHGIKNQTVDCPFMTIHWWGSVSIRHSDLYTLKKSRVNSKMRKIQRGNAKQYLMYGDSIYPWCSHLRSKKPNEKTVAANKKDNKAMSACRQAIEWHYGEGGLLFPYMNYRLLCVAYL